MHNPFLWNSDSIRHSGRRAIAVSMATLALTLFTGALSTARPRGHGALRARRHPPGSTRRRKKTSLKDIASAVSLAVKRLPGGPAG